MLPDRVSNPRPLTYESGALPIALRGPAVVQAPICYKEQQAGSSVPQFLVMECANEYVPNSK